MNSVDATAVWNSIERTWPRRTGIDEAKAWMAVLLMDNAGLDRQYALDIIENFAAAQPERRPTPTQFLKMAMAKKPAVNHRSGKYRCEACGGTTWVSSGGQGVERCQACIGSGWTDEPPVDDEVSTDASTWIARIKESLVIAGPNRAGF